MVKLYSDLVITKQKRNVPSSIPVDRHIGIDTETYKGKAYLICASDGKQHKTLHMPFNEDAGLEQILSFLISLKSRRGEHNMFWFYNLDYDSRAVIKWMEEDDVRALYNSGKVDIGDFTIEYMARKILSIANKKKKKSIKIWDIAQFYGRSLDYNAKRFLDDQKISTIDTITLGSSRQYWKDNINEIIEYCIHDAGLTGRLANHFYKGLADNMDFIPQYPYSTGSIAQTYFLNKCFIPVVDSMPDGVLQYHQDSYRGGRIELLQRGYFPTVHAYDIKSAYPAVMRDLLDTSSGEWVYVKEHDKPEMGIYKINLSWYHPKVSPFSQQGDLGAIYPNGDYQVYVNEKEIEFLDKYSQYNDYEIIDGWEFSPFRYVYPYRDEIDYLFERKESATNDTERLLYKLFINSIYGKTAQAIDKRNKDSEEELKYHTGKLWNPVYCSRITAMTRLSLLEKAMPYIDDVVGFATDSIHITRKLKVPNNPVIGDYTVEYQDVEGLFIMAGIRYLDNQNKMRGFSDKIQLKNLLENNLDKTVIPVEIEKPITLYESLNTKSYVLDDMNVFTKTTKELDINGDMRRIWQGEFGNAKELMEENMGSSPIFV